MTAIAVGILVFIIVYCIYSYFSDNSEGPVQDDSDDTNVFSETSPLEYAMRWMNENPEAFGPVPDRFLEEKDSCLLLT